MEKRYVSSPQSLMLGGNTRDSGNKITCSTRGKVKIEQFSQEVYLQSCKLCQFLGQKLSKFVSVSCVQPLSFFLIIIVSLWATWFSIMTTNHSYLTGDENQICLFGVCLFMTYVPFSPNFNVKIPSYLVLWMTGWKLHCNEHQQNLVLLPKLLHFS